jgi:AraC-like DNA-binding protein
LKSLGLPYSELPAEALAPEHNFAAWREAVWPIFDAETEARADTGGFRAEFGTYNMSPIVMARARVAPGMHRFRRPPGKIAATGLDLVLVQHLVEGGDERVCEGVESRVGAGDTCFADLTRPFSTVTRGFTNLSFVVPRAMLSELVPDVDSLHGIVLRGSTPAGHLLSEHLRALWWQAGRMSLEDAPIVAKGTVGLLAAFAHPALADRRHGEFVIPAAKLFAVRRYIEQNLALPALGPAHLCSTFALSRAALYRLFEPLDGVANYIRARRLECIRASLSDPQHRHRTIADIARACGFGDLSAFTRAFRSRFGFSPGEARAVTAASERRFENTDGESDVQNVLPHWLRAIDIA